MFPKLSHHASIISRSPSSACRVKWWHLHLQISGGICLTSSLSVRWELKPIIFIFVFIISRFVFCYLCNFLQMLPEHFQNFLRTLAGNFSNEWRGNIIKWRSVEISEELYKIHFHLTSDIICWSKSFKWDGEEPLCQMCEVNKQMKTTNVINSQFIEKLSILEKTHSTT